MPPAGGAVPPPKKDVKRCEDCSKSWEQRRAELLKFVRLRAARDLNKMFPPPEALPEPAPRKAAKKKSRDDDGVYRPETKLSAAGKRIKLSRPVLARNAKAIAQIMIAECAVEN